MIQAELTPIPTPSPENTEKITESMKALDELKGLSFDDAITKIANSLVDFAFRLMIAILIFYIGRFIIRKLYKATLRVMTNRKMDPSLTTFVLSLIKMVLYFILIITIIGILGIETSSFLAIFASAGVAIGMALSGTLQNFAGGVLILLLKPYKVNDYIEVQGYAGTVKSIQLFHTIINTIDNKAIIIPNGSLSTSSINNYSLESYRRVDWTVSLSYSTDLQAAKETMMNMLLSDPRVIKGENDTSHETETEDTVEEKTPDESHTIPKQRKWYKRILPKMKKKHISIKETLTEDVDMNAVIPRKVTSGPFVALKEMADSSINFTVRAWTRSSDYWNLFFEMNERFFVELPKAGFSFPFPQMDVHIIPDESDETLNQAN